MKNKIFNLNIYTKRGLSYDKPFCSTKQNDKWKSARNILALINERGYVYLQVMGLLLSCD